MRTRFFVFLLFTGSIAAHCQGTQLWQQSTYDSFEQGTPRGIAIRSDGVLFSAPVAGEVLTTLASTIWSAAADTDGNVYLGTGSPAMVLKISPDGKSRPLLKTSDVSVSVQVVRIGPDGMIYAATLPNGKVYRLNPNGPEITVDAGAKSTTPASDVVFDSTTISDKPNYIWDLAFDRTGRLYIATGGPARIYRIDPKKTTAQPETFFSSSEQHIRALAFAPDGTLYAGTDGRGLVYRIDANGKGFVLFEAPNPEISALALDPAGNLYLAALGDKGRSNLPPITVSSGNVATIRIVMPESISASTDSTLIPNGTTIYQLSPDGAPRQIWASKHDVVYALGWRQNASPAQSGLLAATGNLGHVYQIGTDGTYADLAHLDAKQVTVLTMAGGNAYAATSNPGKLYRFAPPSEKTVGDSVYTSAVHDAKFFSQWGQVETRGSGDYALFARTGNIEQPQEGWSDWQKITPGTTAAGLPKARFLQWKAVFHPGASLSEIGFYSLPQNVAPVVDDIVVQLHARVTPGLNPDPDTTPLQINFTPKAGEATAYSTETTTPLMAAHARDWATIRWAAHDDNDDRLIYSVYFRGDGEANWHLLRKHLAESYLSFDLDRIPDGGYTLRVVASDAGSRPAADALTGFKDSDHFLLDTTPPILSNLQASQQQNNLHVIFDAETKLSTIARAYYSVDAGPWQYIAPAGKISDSLQEHYDFTVPVSASIVNTAIPAEVRPTAPQEHVIAVRVLDRAGNAATAKAVVE